MRPAWLSSPLWIAATARAALVSVQATDQRIQRTGNGWSLGQLVIRPGHGAQPPANALCAADQNEVNSSEVGDSLTFSFNGTRVQLVVDIRDGGASFTAGLDGANAPFDVQPTGADCGVAFDSGIVAQGPHTFVAVVAAPPHAPPFATSHLRILGLIFDDGNTNGASSSAAASASALASTTAASSSTDTGSSSTSASATVASSAATEATATNSTSGTGAASATPSADNTATPSSDHKPANATSIHSGEMIGVVLAGVGVALLLMGALAVELRRRHARRDPSFDIMPPTIEAPPGSPALVWAAPKHLEAYDELGADHVVLAPPLRKPSTRRVPPPIRV